MNDVTTQVSNAPPHASLADGIGETATAARPPGDLGKERNERSVHLRPLKLCYITETLHAGVGRHVVDAVCTLAERGHEVHLIYSPVRADPALLATIKQRPTVRCVAIPMPRSVGPGDIAPFRDIRRYVKDNWPFDLIHGHSSKAGGYARLLKLGGFGPVVYTPHAFITMSPVVSLPKRLVYGLIEAALARVTDRVICCSRNETEHASKLRISREQIEVISIGSEPVAAPSREAIRAKLGLKEDQIAIGFVGRMDKQKAPELFLAAGQLLAPAMPNLTLVMIGDGPMRKTLEADLQLEDLRERVIWLGEVNARDYMPGLDALAISSLYEGFSYVLIEALFAGLPIVSTPVGGVLEAVEHGVNGTIVPHDSPGRMSTAIRRIASRPEMRLAMSRASRARAERFRVSRMVDAMESLYRTLSPRNDALFGRQPAKNGVTSGLPD